MMAAVANDTIREEVLGYFRRNRGSAVRVASLASDIRRENPHFKAVPDAAFRAIVLPMLVTGRLRYTPDLKVQLAKVK